MYRHLRHGRVWNLATWVKQASRDDKLWRSRVIVLLVLSWERSPGGECVDQAKPIGKCGVFYNILITYIFTSFHIGQKLRNLHVQGAIR